MKKLLLEVLDDIKPSRKYEDEILNLASKIIKKVNRNIKDAKVIIGGSGAKGTWLKTFDVDIFVKFNYKKYKDKSSKISDILEIHLKKNFKIKRLHGSRDYFQIKINKFTFELVPILDIKKSDQAKNITDISPLHSKYVLKYKKLIDDMRLTKQFFKSSGVYGAESYIQGFSGYVCELLTIYYGSFTKCIRAASRWKLGEVIDIKKIYKNKNIFLEINKSKLTSPLIIIDPTQKERNAAAALSEERFNILKEKAIEFLKKPSKEFFEIKFHKEIDLVKKFGKGKVIILKVIPIKKKADVAGAKMLKAFHLIKNDLEFYGFKIDECNMIWSGSGQSLFYYAIKKQILSKTYEIQGPSLKLKHHAVLFKKAHKKTTTRNKRLYAAEKRKFTKASAAVRASLKKSNICDNVKNIKLV